MEDSFHKIAAAYNYILDDTGDPNTRSWFMVQSPLPVAAVVILYLSFVTKIGPNFMAKRPPYSLYGPIMVINIFQMIANTWLLMQGMAATWFYFMLKLIDLLDTIIFVLRKKSRQLSFLHIYHHVGILIIAWLAVKYYPGGGSLPVGFLNSTVHAVMYLYYTLAALGPRMTPYLWWKKYLTTMQIQYRHANWDRHGHETKMTAMEHSFNKIAAAYNNILHEGGDSDTRNWFMVQSPLPLVAVIIVYLLFVTRIGPKFMAKRPPYSLYGAIMVINIFQIVANTWLSKQYWSIAWKDSSIVCRGVGERRKTQMELIGAATSWFYFMLKIMDLLDTVIFVLRKKHTQLSFLHLYHHVGTLIVSWLAVKYYPGGATIPVQLFNCSVHTIMFLYYTLAALGPKMRPYLWWKKYLTTIQIVQFFLILGVYFYIVLYQCSIPKFMVYVSAPYTITILILFLDFYNRSYKVGRNEVNKTE
ncbi:very long chain fatty acid elongase 7-like [Hetaerina americana]|uniref:very long chain fatty acid elongase 7-like n=1 Tax=Hetaerina americana TaxID=62018 RepID=UPI003A7F338E